MAYDLPSVPGVLTRHADDCSARDGRRCTCGPIGYRAADGGRPIGPLLETPEQALSWRREQHTALADAERGNVVITAIDHFLNEAAAGSARAPEGRRYTRTERRELRQALGSHVIPALGELPLRELRTRDVNDLLHDLDKRLPAPQVQAVENALRDFFDYALERRLIDQDPFSPPPSETYVAHERATVSDDAIWLSLKVAAVAFVLIALILVAESV
jgi:hypothetical protein